MLSEPILVVARIVQALDSLGVSYVVGGSLASSIYGIPRATQDVDLVADLETSHADKLERLLSGDFYIDADMIREAILKRASFNVIHLATMFKADVFVMKRDAWSREEMSRARQEQLDGPEGSIAVRFASQKTLSCISSSGSDSETRSLTVSGPTSSAFSRFRAPCSTTLTSITGLLRSASLISSHVPEASNKAAVTTPPNFVLHLTKPSLRSGFRGSTLLRWPDEQKAHERAR